MSVGPKTVERYTAAFERWASNGAGDVPAWLSELRQKAIGRFADAGFPDTHQEAWRFTSVEPIARGRWVRPGLPQGVTRAALEGHLIGAPSERIALVCVDGRFVAGLSSLDSLPAGFHVGGLAAALAEGPDLVQAHLGRCLPAEANAFSALNTAFLEDGAFVHATAESALDRPVQILFVTTAASPATLIHPRTLVVAERGSRLSVIETHVGLGAGEYWTNAVTEVAVGENANVDTYRLQREHASAYHTASTASSQGRDSVYSLVTFAFGSRLARHDLYALLDGPGGECTLNGLSILGDHQHADHHTIIDHAKPHCNSWEFFNGVYDDHARGVFNGRIIVRPGAQRTDSKQTNNNLLLSEEARADSQPQLEIYADDVKCTHGATLGPIDDQSMFYLRSRGLDQRAARNLLTYGFAGEILSYVTLDDLRRRLDQGIMQRLGDGEETRGPA